MTAALHVKPLALGLQAGKHTGTRARAKAKVIIAGGGSVHEATTHSKELSVAFREIPATADTLLNLAPGRCRMPVGPLLAEGGADTLFCGAETLRDRLTPTGALTFETYCPACTAIAYRPLPGGGRPTERQLRRELRRHL